MTIEIEFFGAPAGDQFQLGRQLRDVFEEQCGIVPGRGASAFHQFTRLKERTEQTGRGVERVDAVIVREAPETHEIEVAVVNACDEGVGQPEQLALDLDAGLITPHALVVGHEKAVAIDLGRRRTRCRNEGVGFSVDPGAFGGQEVGEILDGDIFRRCPLDEDLRPILLGLDLRISDIVIDVAHAFVDCITGGRAQDTGQRLSSKRAWHQRRTEIFRWVILEIIDRKLDPQVVRHLPH